MARTYSHEPEWVKVSRRENKAVAEVFHRCKNDVSSIFNSSTIECDAHEKNPIHCKAFLPNHLNVEYNFRRRVAVSGSRSTVRVALQEFASSYSPVRYQDILLPEPVRGCSCCSSDTWVHKPIVLEDEAMTLAEWLDFID